MRIDVDVLATVTAIVIEHRLVPRSIFILRGSNSAVSSASDAGQRNRKKAVISVSLDLGLRARTNKDRDRQTDCRADHGRTILTELLDSMTTT